MTSATCATCGLPFRAKRPDARFCSGRCRVAAHRAGHNKPAVEAVTDNPARMYPEADVTAPAQPAATSAGQETALGPSALHGDTVASRNGGSCLSTEACRSKPRRWCLAAGWPSRPARPCPSCGGSLPGSGSPCEPKGDHHDHPRRVRRGRGGVVRRRRHPCRTLCRDAAGDHRPLPAEDG
jgi:hypothetical protein